MESLNRPAGENIHHGTRHADNSCMCVLCGGDGTQKSWKPLLNTILVSEAHRNVSHSGTYSYCQHAVPIARTKSAGQSRRQTGGFDDDPSYDYDSR